MGHLSSQEGSPNRNNFQIPAEDGIFVVATTSWKPHKTLLRNVDNISSFDWAGGKCRRLFTFHNEKNLTKRLEATTSLASKIFISSRACYVSQSKSPASWRLWGFGGKACLNYCYVSKVCEGLLLAEMVPSFFDRSGFSLVGMDYNYPHPIYPRAVSSCDFNKSLQNLGISKAPAAEMNAEPKPLKSQTFVFSFVWKTIHFLSLSLVPLVKYFFI